MLQMWFAIKNRIDLIVSFQWQWHTVEYYAHSIWQMKRKHLRNKSSWLNLRLFKFVSRIFSFRSQYAGTGSSICYTISITFFLFGKSEPLTIIVKIRQMSIKLFHSRELKMCGQATVIVAPCAWVLHVETWKWKWRKKKSRNRKKRR